MTRKKKEELRQGGNASPMQTIYALLHMMGLAVHPNDIRPGYTEGGGRVTIAIPRIKFALSFDKDDPQPLIDEGWEVQSLVRSDIEPFSRVFFAAMAGRIAEEKMSMDPTVKNTSEPEERLLNAILWKGLPTPDRNKKFFREDGTELTTPDFTWEEYKLAFFMDGAYWHSIKDDKEIIKKIKSNSHRRNEIIAKRSDKVRKDGNIRSELTTLGYFVLSCTDADIETQDGLDQQVARIEKIINQTRASRMIGDIDDSQDSDGELFDSLSQYSDEEGEVSNTKDSSEDSIDKDSGSKEEKDEPESQPQDDDDNNDSSDDLFSALDNYRDEDEDDDEDEYDDEMFEDDFEQGLMEEHGEDIADMLLRES